MTRHPLPVLDSSRTEFGYSRSVCACPACRVFCRYVPGFLVPADLERLRDCLAPREDLQTWARQFLLASPGATLLLRGRLFRIPTLVPARQKHGTCLFLTAEERCSVHAVAPYGCAFFDDHQQAAEADRRSLHGLQAVLEAWVAKGHYAQVWIALHEAGLRAPNPQSCVQQMQQAREQPRP